MNEVVLIGRIANKLELKEVSNSKMLNFNLAVNRTSDKNKTDFIPIVVFNQLAENMVKWQNVGNMIAVIGSIRQNEYTDKEGNKRYSTNVLASRVQFLESNKNKKEEVSSTLTDDDTPF